jgi:ankyrin repeat protein
MIYAAAQGLDKASMYMSLRTKNVDQEDDNGNNIFIMYILKNDLAHCTQLLMRDANINHINKNGKTPLHLAVENKLESATIKFLLTYGANPHIEDKDS